MLPFKRITGPIICGLMFMVGSVGYGSGMKSVPSAATSSVPYSAIGQVTSGSGAKATGTRIADKLVVTSSRAFFEDLQTETPSFQWSSDGITVFTATSAHMLPQFLSNALEAGIDSAAVKEQDLLILVFEESLGASPYANIAAHDLRVPGHRLLVGYAPENFSSEDPLRNNLQATASGEAVYSVFGKISEELELYHTGNLKIGSDNYGIPVFGFDQQNWVLEGWVVDNDEALGSCEVTGLTESHLTFIETLLEEPWTPSVLTNESIDFNNVRAGAIPLPMNYGILSSIAPGSDTDYHEFEVITLGNYVVQSYGNMDVNGMLFNSTGQLIAQNEDSGDSFNYYFNLLLQPGKYYVRTVPFSGTIDGEYGVSLEWLEDPQTYLDDGFQPAVVRALDLNTVNANNRIAISGEIDTYSVTTAQKGLFIVWTESELDTKLSYVSETLPFAQNDDAPGLQLQSLLGISLDAGVQQLQVQASNAGEFGPYQISSHFVPLDWVQVATLDANDQFSDAIRLNDGSDLLELTISGLGDWDYYRVNGDPLSPKEISIVSSTVFPVKVLILDQNFQQVGEIIEDTQITLTLAASSGAYHLVVSATEATQYAILMPEVSVTTPVEG